MKDDCDHDIAAFVLLFGRIVWICKICYAHDGGNGPKPYGCQECCDKCIEDARRVYLPIFRENTIKRVDGPPSFIDQWAQRIYNEAWGKLDDGQQMKIIEQVKEKNAKTYAKMEEIVRRAKSRLRNARGMWGVS
jgi:hypothetical protein